MPNYTMFWLVMLLAFLAVTGRMEDFITMLRQGKPPTNPDGSTGQPGHPIVPPPPKPGHPPGPTVG